MQKRLIIVSNRLPISIKRKNGKLELKRSTGGLVSAMTSLPKDKFSMVWIGAADFKKEAWEEFGAGGKTDFSIVPVFLDKKTEGLYYNGFSNTVLWPLFHYFPSFAEYDESFFRAYKLVNQQFAEVVKSVAGPEDTVWVHDYHLMLLPGFLKKGAQKVNSSFFLHIPFPTYELFKLVPEDWRTEILHSLLSCEVCGFQIQEHASHFKRALSYFLGIETMNNQAVLNGHVTFIRDYPISIDFSRFNNAFNDPAVQTVRRQIRKKHEDVRIIFSIDRLDYSKGVINRLQAYEELLKVHPDQRGKIIFFINVIPSRENISRYAERKKLIEESISRINGLFGSIHWQPIIYQYRHLSFEDLVGCYTSCDIALVTPLRDGMNLVAKEFVASRKDGRGTLILSEFAGAAIELSTALMVNPNDVFHMKEAMLQALAFTVKEQEDRMGRMQQVIRENDVNKWVSTFLGDVEKSRAETVWAQPNLMSSDDKYQIFEAYGRARNRLVLLDYDGTLVPFHTRPVEAVPGDVIKELVNRLSANRRNRVMLISGRDAATLETWFRGTKIDLVAEHGSMYRAADAGEWTGTPGISVEWKDEVRKCVEKYAGMIPGSFIEEKEYSIAWHYRAIENIDEESVKLNLGKELMLLNMNDNFDILQGNKVIEVKSTHINKGRFVQGVVANGDYDFVLAIGDDVTDEDMFNALREDHHFTIKVGLVSSAARYNLVGVNQVLTFLDHLCSRRNFASP